MNEKKKIAVGIDLGTTFSIISYFREGRPEPIPDQDGPNYTIPSTVYYPEGGEPIVGESAIAQEKMDPDRLTQWIKRNMGEDYRKQIGDDEYSPEQVSADILKYLKQNAEVYLGTEVTQAVITVPAYFGDRERAATAEAGRLAGLEVLQLLPEPVAAAFAYAIDGTIEPGERNILVYDLGGGTFDITLLKAIYQKESEDAVKLDANVLAKDGARELGGRDWDKALIDYLADKAEEEFGNNPKEDLLSEINLRDRANEAKHQLSRTEKVPVVVDGAGNTIAVERQEFEQLTQGLLYQTEERLNNVMKEAEEKHGVTWNDIDVLLLVGGSTRMPMVRSMLERVIADQGANVPIQLHKQVDLTVSMGAAYYAEILSEGKLVIPSDDADRPVIIHGDFVDTVKAIGVLAHQGQADGTYTQINVIIIPDGSETDQDFTVDTLATQHDNQTGVRFDVTEGNSEIPDEVQTLGGVTLTGLPPNRPKGRPLKVILTYNKSGIITGKGIDVETGQEVDISIDRKAISSAA
jgi:molecular chaperone DnaK